MQVPRPEPGPKLWALSSEVPSPLSPSTHSWSPLALQSCSQRERGQDAFPKDQGCGLATFQGWAEFILEIQELYVAAGVREKSRCKTRAVNGVKGLRTVCGTDLTVQVVIDIL